MHAADRGVEAGKLGAEARAKGLAEFAGPQGFGGIAQSHHAVITELQGSDVPAAAVRSATDRLKTLAMLLERWGKRQSAEG